MRNRPFAPASMARPRERPGSSGGARPGTVARSRPKTSRPEAASGPSRGRPGPDRLLPIGAALALVGAVLELVAPLLWPPALGGIPAMVGAAALLVALAGLLRRLRDAAARRRRQSRQPLRFSDVGGNPAALAELTEIIQLLRAEGGDRALRVNPPAGVLISGPPGTGKTLLARAVGGEAGLPFLSVSAPDLLASPQGCAQLRDLFARASASAPAIVFIDDVDAVGQRRSVLRSEAAEERERLLNQLLVEMGAWQRDRPVLVLAATNRPEVLDPALVRRGRFDRHIHINLPDLQGRREILSLAAGTVPKARDVDLGAIARRSAGMSGADLAATVNEAALLAARAGAERVRQRDLFEALDRMIAGPPAARRGANDHERWIVAYHEAGHAVVAHALDGVAPLERVSITARTKVLGLTTAAGEDRSLWTRDELIDQLAVLLAGRLAEELVFGEPTTAGSEDLQRAGMLAQSMVVQHSMGGTVGFGAVPWREEEPPPPEAGSQDAMAEVARVLAYARHRAGAAIATRRRSLERLAAALIEHEQLDAAELGAILGPKRASARRPAAHGDVILPLPELAQDLNRPTAGGSTAPLGPSGSCETLWEQGR